MTDRQYHVDVRRQKYKKYRLEGYSQRASALKAGYSKWTAKQSRIEKTIPFDVILEKHGLTDDYLAKHAEEGMKATKFHDGQEIPDHFARHKYYDTVLKLRKKVAAENSKQPGETRVIIIRETNGNQNQSGHVPRQVSVQRI